MFRIIIVRRKRNDADARAFAESFFVEKTRAPSVGPDRDQINHRVRNTVLFQVVPQRKRRVIGSILLNEWSGNGLNLICREAHVA